MRVLKETSARRWLPARVTAVLVLGGLVATAAVLVTVRPARPDGNKAAAATPAATSAPVTTLDPGASPDPDLLAKARAIVAPAAPPTQLAIPAIGVNAVVEPVGLDAQGRMATPSKADRVAWFQPGAAPGDVGDAVIDGHLDWTDGPAVFWRLGKLRRGDEVTVARADGSRATFVVDSTSVMTYTASTDSLFTKAGPPSLTLITCAGIWDRQRATYLQRLVVHASLAA